MISEKAEKIIHDIPGRYYTIELDWKEVLAPITDYISTLESENARLKDAQRWIPVSERLPEEKQKVLITWAPKYSQIFSAIFGTGFTDWTFTHWMPLPEPPEVTE